MGPLTLGVSAGVPTPSAGTYTFSPNTPFGQVIARAIVDGGLDVDLVNSGVGMLVLESGASPHCRMQVRPLQPWSVNSESPRWRRGQSYGNATVSVKSLTLSARVETNPTLRQAEFTTNGVIAAAKSATASLAQLPSPIRVSLTPALTVGAGKSLTTSTRDNYVLVMPGISGAGTVNLGGIVETAAR